MAVGTQPSRHCLHKAGSLHNSHLLPPAHCGMWESKSLTVTYYQASSSSHCRPEEMPRVPKAKQRTCTHWPAALRAQPLSQ